jgi:hypothetical protein
MCFVLKLRPITTPASSTHFRGTAIDGAGSQIRAQIGIQLLHGWGGAILDPERYGGDINRGWER